MWLQVLKDWTPDVDRSYNVHATDISLSRWWGSARAYFWALEANWREGSKRTFHRWRNTVSWPLAVQHYCPFIKCMSYPMLAHPLSLCSKQPWMLSGKCHPKSGIGADVVDFFCFLSFVWSAFLRRYHILRNAFVIAYFVHRRGEYFLSRKNTA